MKKHNTNTSETVTSENSLDERVLNMENNYQSSITEPIEGTPFQIQKHEENGWRLLLGIHAITNWDIRENAEKEARKKAKSQDWTFMITVIATIVDKVIEQKNVEMAEYIKEMQTAGNEQTK